MKEKNRRGGDVHDSLTSITGNSTGKAGTTRGEAVSSRREVEKNLGIRELKLTKRWRVLLQEHGGGEGQV